MTWLSMLIALIKTSSSKLLGNAWLFQYFTNLVDVEKAFMTVGWIIFGIAALVGIILAVTGFYKGFKWGGCIVVFFLIWIVTLPLFEWITWRLATGVLNSFDPVIGITNYGSFLLNAFFLFLLGAG